MTTHTDACTLQYLSSLYLSQVGTPRKQHVTPCYRPGTVGMQPEARLLGFIYLVTPSPQALVFTGETINFNWVSNQMVPLPPSAFPTANAPGAAPLEADRNSHIPFHRAMCCEETDIRHSTHWTLSCGLAFRLPLITEAGSSKECSHIELAPLLYKVSTI